MGGNGGGDRGTGIFEEVEVNEELEEVEESIQYMHPSHGLKRSPPQTHQALSM